jgi:hypothetical protein
MTYDDLLDFDRGTYGHVESGRGTPLFRHTPTSGLSRIRMGAAQLGISEEAYLAHLEDGELWCSRHREWHPADRFGPSPKRASGKQQNCRRTPTTGDAS